MSSRKRTSYTAPQAILDDVPTGDDAADEPDVFAAAQAAGMGSGRTQRVESDYSREGRQRVAAAAAAAEAAGPDESYAERLKRRRLGQERRDVTRELRKRADEGTGPAGAWGTLNERAH